MEQQVFTSKKKSKYFTKSEYDHIGHDFNFEALGELLGLKFAELIKDEVRFCYIKKFIIEDHETCYFLYFYAEDYKKEDYRVITAYHNKENYFSIDKISKRDLEILGLDVKGLRRK